MLRPVKPVIVLDNNKQLNLVHQTRLRFFPLKLNKYNRIGGVMVNVLASSAVDRGFEPRSGQTKYYKIGICCVSAKHAALMRKNKDWSARNQNNVSEWSDMSVVSVNLFSPWYSWKIAELALNNNHSLTPYGVVIQAS